MSYNCSGEYAAHRAGHEAPRCFLCDQPINELTELHFTPHGKAVCNGCWNEAEQSTIAMASAIRVHEEATRETEAREEARFFCTRNVNIHDA